jgi:hypothetical protein
LGWEGSSVLEEKTEIKEEQEQEQEQEQETAAAAEKQE